MRGRRNLHYDSKGHGDLCGRIELVYDPERPQGIRCRRNQLHKPKGLSGRFYLVYDPKM